MFTNEKLKKPQKERNTGLTDYLRTIAVGQGFNLPINLRSSAISCGKQIGIKLITRKVDDTTLYLERVS